MRSPCWLCVCVSPLIISFSMRSVSYKRKVGGWFFPELLVIIASPSMQSSQVALSTLKFFRISFSRFYSFTMCTLHQIFLEHAQINKDKMDVICSTHAQMTNKHKTLIGKANAGNHLGDLGVNGITHKKITKRFMTMQVSYVISSVSCSRSQALTQMPVLYSQLCHLNSLFEWRTYGRG
jgi:hypothetical protein